MRFEVKPLDAEVGVEVIGLDLGQPVDEPTRQALYDTWLEFGILLFRGIGTTSERHLALSRCFGELEVHPVESIRLKDHPEIISLRSTGDAEQIIHIFDGEAVAGRIPWHTDLIYTPTPCRGALLRMVHKPSSGGQTGWIDTAAAYDALPESLKEKIEGLEARYDFVVDICDMRFGKPEKLEHGSMGNIEYPAFPDVAHPLVWTHPESGRKALMTSPTQLVDMVGMERVEGDPILEELVAHATDGRFTYVHEWELGDMVLWDNWRTMHTAFGTPPECEREVQRTTIHGELQTGRLL
jgi:taurine dioxygenase